MKQYLEQDMHHELCQLTHAFLIESGVDYKRDIKLDDSLQRHLGIDSLGRAELFRRFEKAFDVSLPDNLLAEVETLSDVANYLRSVKPAFHTKAKRHVITEHGAPVEVDPSQAQSLTHLLLLYGEQAPEKVHTYFQTENGKEETLTYGELLQGSRRVAQRLREFGLKEGETVAIMQPTTFGFFYTFFGTLLAGGIPVPIYPPFRPHMIEAYAKTEARILNSAQVRVLVTFDRAEKLSRLLQGFVPSLKVVTTVHELMKATPLESVHRASADQFAFIQYTSGSTSDPKGVLLTHQNLLSNIRAYGKAVAASSRDVTVSWLPLYHDFGLIGSWLGSLYYGAPLILMTPFSFLSHPEKWLWTIHYHRGTIACAPNFAYELCIHKIDPERLEGLDLSSWRIAANGAEKVYPRTLEQFSEKFKRYGFNADAMMPVYGLAESTVGLCIPPLGRGARVDDVDRKQFEEERLALPASDKHALSFVGCGVPIEGHAIRVVDDDGAVLPERHVGNLQFKGPSSMQGYFNNPIATRAVFHDGWIDSGDLAYLVDGEVFVTGRRKDLIIKAGRNLYPSEVEELVGLVPGVRVGCVTAFDVSDEKKGTEQLIVVAETREKGKVNRDEIIRQINEVIANALDISPDKVLLVAPHTIPKTSSGKLQRAACKAMYQQGRLERWRVPAWMQVSKLGVAWFGRKMLGVVYSGSKMLYTLYMAIVVIATTLPMLVLAYILPAHRFRKECKAWLRFIIRAAGCPLKVVNADNLTKANPVVYVVNHASFSDAVVLMAVLPDNAVFVGKKELFSAPIIKTFMKKLGFLSIDRQDIPKGMSDAKQMLHALSNHQSLVVFPEGTFGYAAGLRPFRLGAFKTAAEAKVAVCPIALSGTRNILRDDEKLMRPGRVMVTVGEPIKPQGDDWQAVTSLRDLARAEIATHCGEPSLDFIAANTIADKIER